MNATYLMLDIANNRVQFWQDELQAAFRTGNTARAAECDRLIEEYGLLTSQALTALRTFVDNGAAQR
jgi:hypothetical protein